jgi:hypothetical protein
MPRALTESIDCFEDEKLEAKVVSTGSAASMSLLGPALLVSPGSGSSITMVVLVLSSTWVVGLFSGSESAVRFVEVAASSTRGAVRFWFLPFY